MCEERRPCKDTVHVAVFTFLNFLICPFCRRHSSPDPAAATMSSDYTDSSLGPLEENLSLGRRPLPEDGSCGEAHSNERPCGHDSEILSSPKFWQIKHFSKPLNLIFRPTLNCKVIVCHFTAKKTKVQRGDLLTQVQKDLPGILSGTALRHAACHQRTRKRGSQHSSQCVLSPCAVCTPPSSPLFSGSLLLPFFLHPLSLTLS